MPSAIGWGILGTAHIAESAFLPALHAAGGGQALAVAGRDRKRTEAFSQSQGIERALTGYQSLLDTSEIHAVYIPLPNSLHAEWTVKALEAGKAVLCEKPLCGSLEQCRQVLAAARRAEKPLWEAFVFPYHRQQRRLLELVGSRAVGRLDEIHSEFFFNLTKRENIRLSSELGGGALNDVGCYPLRFAQLIFEASPVRGTALAHWTHGGVDREARGVVDYGVRRLVFACGMTRDSGTFTRIIGDEGEIRVSNPFHPRADDTIEIRAKGKESVERLGVAEPTFAEAIRHIHAVLREAAEPEFTALDDSWGTELALDLLHRSARSGQAEHAAP
jgi:predicted dehydrogenase